MLQGRQDVDGTSKYIHFSCPASDGSADHDDEQKVAKRARMATLALCEDEDENTGSSNLIASFEVAGANIEGSTDESSRESSQA
jgi:hypothetical protein